MLMQRSSVLLPLPLGRVDAEVDSVENEVVAEALAHVFEAHHRNAVAQ